MSHKSKQTSANQKEDISRRSSSSTATLVSLLRQARLDLRLSQREVAERVGTTPDLIRRLEGGSGSVSLLIAAMDALDFAVTGLPEGRSLGERLRVARERRKLDRTRLGERTGLNETAIADIEGGEGNVGDLLRVLRVLAPAIGRRAPERVYWSQGQKEDRDSRFTPGDFMEGIYSAFGKVDLDPCAHPLSPVVARQKFILDGGHDGLLDDWSGSLAFVNPPFSALLKWLRRAHEQWQNGNVAAVVCLVPVRTDSAFFHETLSRDADIFLLKGRVKFLNPDGKAQATPFSLMLVAFGSRADQRKRYASLAEGFWLPRRR